MKRLILLLIIIAPVIQIFAQQLGSAYRLKRVIPVEGRQGIAVDSNFYYVSDTRALYKYTKDGKLVMSNLKPFRHPERANHFGDIDVYNGEIYTGNEKFEFGQGHNISIDVYDASTLKWKRSITWESASGQVECSGLAVDGLRGLVWMSDWVDSRYVYCYSLETGQYYNKMQLRPCPYWTQGICIADGKMLISADDGDASFGIADNIYVADIDNVPFAGLKEGIQTTVVDGKPVRKTGLVPAGVIAGRVSLFREMTDFRRAGEIEGLSVDPVNGDLVVLNNRGNEILLGMPIGPYKDEGYTHEIHELYIYEKTK